MRFLVVYSGGSVREGFSRDDWEGLPREGVVRVAQACAPQLPPGGDGYWMDPAGVINHSNSLLALEARNNARGDVGLILLGETVSYSEWNATDATVLAWMRSLQEDDCGCS